MTQFIMVLFSFFIFPINAQTEFDQLQVEVFDVETEQVIKTIPMTDLIRNKTVIYIKSINGIFQGIDPIPDRGYLIRIPLEPAVSINNEWFQSNVDSVIFIIPSQGESSLLMFDKNNLPRVFTFQEEVNELLEVLNFDQINETN